MSKKRLVTRDEDREQFLGMNCKRQIICRLSSNLASYYRDAVNKFQTAEGIDSKIL